MQNAWKAARSSVCASSPYGVFWVINSQGSHTEEVYLYVLLREVASIATRRLLCNPSPVQSVQNVRCSYDLRTSVRRAGTACPLSTSKSDEGAYRKIQKAFRLNAGGRATVGYRHLAPLPQTSMGEDSKIYAQDVRIFSEWRSYCDTQRRNGFGTRNSDDIGSPPVEQTATWFDKVHGNVA